MSNPLPLTVPVRVKSNLAKSRDFVEVQGVIDTASSHTIVSSEIYKLARFPDTTQYASFRIRETGAIASGWIIDADLEILGREWKGISLYVLPDLEVKFIIGRDILGTEAGIDLLRELISGPIPKSTNAGDDLDPIRYAPSALDFELSTAGRVRLSKSAATLPVFTRQGGETDHADRLETCRILAGDLYTDLKANLYQVRGDYARSLSKYAARLPTLPDGGNIFLADAEARSLRNMFSSDAESLPTGFASRLKTLLEQHIGLRVYYPGLSEFYQDVRSGRIETPISLDAIDGFVKAIRDNTPDVFEPPVVEALEGAAGSVELQQQTASRNLESVDPQQPMPPKDPLGELDPRKARDLSFAGAANSLWKVIRQGAELHKNVEAWEKLGKQVAPYIHDILKWLRSFLSNSDGVPPLPPTLSI